MLSKTFGPIVFPAVRTQNSSPKPVSNKISGQTLESEQLSTMAYGFCPSSRLFSIESKQ